MLNKPFPLKKIWQKIFTPKLCQNCNFEFKSIKFLFVYSIPNSRKMWNISQICLAPKFGKFIPKTSFIGLAPEFPWLFAQFTLGNEKFKVKVKVKVHLQLSCIYFGLLYFQYREHFASNFEKLERDFALEMKRKESKVTKWQNFENCWQWQFKFSKLNISLWKLDSKRKYFLQIVQNHF